MFAGAKRSVQTDIYNMAANKKFSKGRRFGVMSVSVGMILATQKRISD